MYPFGAGVSLEPGRYRFEFRVRGTPDLFAEWDLADGGRRVSREVRIPLTEEWQRHTLEFEVQEPFRDQPIVRFRMPREAKGTFGLADTRLKRIE